MKKRIIAAAAAALFLMTVLAGCGSAKKKEFTVKLPSNPTTGYTWEVTQTNPIFDIQSEFVPDETEGEVTGAGGTETFVLTPKEKGETDVTFEYGQHWEGGETDSSFTYKLKVDKKLRVEMESMTGNARGDIDTLPELPQAE